MNFDQIESSYIYTETNDTVIYLGAKITNKGGFQPEIRRSIEIVKDVLGRLVKIWKDINIRKMTKIRLLKPLIFSFATYGSKSWTLHSARE